LVLGCSYVRMRQLAPWVFAGAPGHPALRELCDEVAARAAGGAPLSADPRLDGAERSGAGVFTDVLLAHAAAHPPARRDDPWGVRLLPRVRFAAPQEPAYGLAPGDPGVAVLHHPAPRPAAAGGTSGGAGGWAASGAWPWAVSVQGVTSEVARRWRQRSEDAEAAALARMAERDAATGLYPVSLDFDPPFDLLTHRAGRGERQSGADVSAALTTHGGWQPSVQPARRPSLVDVVVGSLGGHSARGVLVDVGAGYGLLSLAAAARGHRVHAWELGPASLEALEASLRHNGFQHLVQVRPGLGCLAHRCCAAWWRACCAWRSAVGGGELHPTRPRLWYPNSPIPLNPSQPCPQRAPPPPPLAVTGAQGASGVAGAGGLHLHTAQAQQQRRRRWHAG
jgi:hypothetical protein